MHAVHAPCRQGLSRGRLRINLLIASAIVEKTWWQIVKFNTSEASGGDPFASSTLRKPRCIKWRALIGLLLTL